MCVYKISKDNWARLTEFERKILRGEYRWMREHGWDRIGTKGTIDRFAILLACGVRA